MFLLLVLGPDRGCKDGEDGGLSSRGDQTADVDGGGVGGDGGTIVDGDLSASERASITAKATLLGEHATDLLVRSLR